MMAKHKASVIMFPIKPCMRFVCLVEDYACFIWMLRCVISSEALSTSGEFVKRVFRD